MKKTNLKLGVAILICLFCVPLIGTDVKGGLLPGPPDPPSRETFGYSAILFIRNHPLELFPITLLFNIVFVVVDGVRLDPSRTSVMVFEDFLISPRCTLLGFDNDLIYIGGQLVALDSSWRWRIDFNNIGSFELIYWCKINIAGEHIFSFSAHGEGDIDLGHVYFHLWDCSFVTDILLLYADLLLEGSPFS